MNRPRPELEDLAQHLDRVRRRLVVHRAGVQVQNLSGGWLSVRPEGARRVYPSVSSNRVYWMARREPVRAGDIDEALAAVRGLGHARILFWAAPWTIDVEAERALAGIGAERSPHVEHWALAREAARGEVVVRAASSLGVRRLEADEVAGVLEAIRPWYGDEGVAAGRSMLAMSNGGFEFFAAFDGDRPVAFSLAVMDGAWVYLAAAGTDPAHRRRGAQAGMIAARVARAAELGAEWCACETNTAVMTSMDNLERCGFARRIEWAVWAWEERGEGVGGAEALVGP